jgi:succinate dehydrogenase / fumarate reductase flavoprotein subunit
MAARKPKIAIVGGGLAGLAAAMRCAEDGANVDLFSVVQVKRSHSVCAQGGINACNEVARQQGYSEWMHMDETLYGGDFLANQPPVYEMAYWAPKIIDLMDRAGVPFNRTEEGFRDLRLFGGSLYKRTHFAGASTGQQLLYALDEQVRRWEVAGRINKYEHWEFLWPVLDADGVCRGLVAQDMRTMEIRSFRADAVIMATGGCGTVFGKSTNSTICNGAAAARCYEAGAWLGNAEFIQVHPTAIPGQDKLRLMSESARGEGGRVWVPRKKGDTRKPMDIPENERWYFLEEKYPKYGNLVPRDIATREIFFICQQGFGVAGGRQVYLDITHLPDENKHKLYAILEIYEKFTGDDPREMPMLIFPGVHYTMGGLWTTYTPRSDAKGLTPGAPNNMMTNLPRLYAFGEVNYQYHGATRLGANALLNCIFDGIFCGPSATNWGTEQIAKTDAAPQSLFDAALQQEKAKASALLAGKGNDNPYLLHQEMGEWMTDYVTVIRDEQNMNKTLERLQSWKQRSANMKLADTGEWQNQNLIFARALKDMIRYAEAILVGAILRKESRGSHYREDYQERDDANFLKTTIAKYDAKADKPVISYEEVQLGLVEPRARTYGRTDAEGAKPAKPAVTS